LTSNADFARQLAERNRALKPRKAFRTSAPKGAGVATGYVDRAKSRQELEDDKEASIKALDERLEKGEIDQATYEQQRGEIVGGDLSSTHLVKGLDFKLLERIRRGEDVYGDGAAQPGASPQAEDDFDDELDNVLSREITAKEKERREKKGQLSTVAMAAAGRKRTRDEILAEFRAARAAAAQPKESELGGRFKKITAPEKPGTRIERDSKGREVLIIVDEDGHVKRKIRKTQPGDEESRDNDLPMPDKNAKPLGMEVPEMYRQGEVEPEDDSNLDIFDDVGDDYDPLAGLDEDSGSGSDDEAESGKHAGSRDATGETSEAPAAAEKPAGPRNYFRDAKTSLPSQEEVKAPSLSDPTIMAALKRAAAINPIGKAPGDEDSEEKARRERMKQLLEAADRDAEDMDMGFGMSRNEDEEDFDDQKVKLSKWGDDDDGEGEKGGHGGRAKRKRGPKKRKGDGNNAADVMRVLEQRRAAAS
jgi:hypothetical protein